MSAVLQPLPRVAVLVLLLLGLIGSRDGRSQERADGPAFELKPAVYEPADVRSAAEIAEGLLPSASGRPDDGRTSGPAGELERISRGGGSGSGGADAARGGRRTSAEGGVILYRVCRVTAYCDRGRTAAGVPSGVGQCAAPGYVPLGSLVRIPELEQTFLVTDRTHKRFRKSTVDLFMPSEQECKQFGRNFFEVEIIVPPPDERARNLGYR